MSVFSSLRQLIKPRPTGHIPNVLFHFSPVRNVRAETKVKWIRPAKILSFQPVKSGDQSPYEEPDPNSFRKYYDVNEKLKNCTNDNVRKIFTMGYQSRYINWMAYRQNLIDAVKAHKYDKDSIEIKIANLTASIRLKQTRLSRKRRIRGLKGVLNELIHRRKSKLLKLRKYDYRKFEWLLEKLNLIFKPNAVVQEMVCRKKSVKLLASLKKMKIQEEKLAAYKKKLDDMKVPYLEKRLEKLLWIRDQEASLQLTPTVTESDIEQCRKDIENVKLEIEERNKKGYKRKIHPYLLEVYEPEEETVTK